MKGGRTRPKPSAAPPVRGSRIPGSQVHGGPGRGSRIPGSPSPGRAGTEEPAGDGWTARSGGPWPLFVAVPPGLEEPAAREVRVLVGAGRAVPGGVETEGDLGAVVRLNLGARIASRVLLRLADGPASAAARLARGIDWKAFLAPGATFDLELSGAGRSPGSFARAVEGAAAAAVGARPEKGGVSIHLRVHEGRVTVSLDSSGEHLHRRGYRKETGVAPLRESLAAGILALAGYTGAEPLVDPMCGSGTFVIEAALRAMDRAPGLLRSFACESWPCLPAAVVEAERERVRRAERPAPAAAIVGSDRNAGALGVARRNATAAGVFPHLALARRDVAELVPPPGTAPGIVVANPPYGRRVGEHDELPGLYRTLGLRLREHFRGWTAAILVADRRLEPLLALPSPTAHPLRNGGLPCRLLVARLP
jgi:putative N6-adenine-specific DNA methylase